MIHSFFGFLALAIGAISLGLKKTAYGQRLFAEKFGEDWKSGAAAFLFGLPLVIVGAVLAIPGCLSAFHDILSLVFLVAIVFAVWYFKPFFTKSEEVGSKEKSDEESSSL